MAADDPPILLSMRVFLIGFLLCARIGFAAAQANIQHVDFKNFSYPFSGTFGWPSRLVWLDMVKQEHVRLVNGQALHDSGNGVTSTGLTLEDVQFADLTDSGGTDAIVVLRYDTGGTQYSNFVYIYSLVVGKPKLLACFHSGDRAASGLYKVYGQKGKLVVELFDPRKSEGDCCSTGFIRTRYRWNRRKFEAVGKHEFGTPKTPTRVPVTVFGTHK